VSGQGQAKSYEANDCFVNVLMNPAEPGDLLKFVPGQKNIQKIFGMFDLKSCSNYIYMVFDNVTIFPKLLKMTYKTLNLRNC
jgi:hypothetical protein